MARKCKREKCSTLLPSSDGHLFCEACRELGKGDDPCTKGKHCKICDSLKAREEEKKKKKLEDKLLDEPDPAENLMASNSSLEQTLATLSSQLTQLSSRMADIEGSVKHKSNPSTSSTYTVDEEVDRTEDPQSDEEGSAKQDTLPDRDEDPTLVEVIQAVKSLLELPDCLPDSVQPPSAFYKKQTSKSTKKQLSAFPPEEDILAMWRYRQLQASGKDQAGKNSHSPLHIGQFLPFIRVAVENYLSVPQSSTLKAQQIPDAFQDLTKVKSPSSIEIPFKQFEKNEKAMRETIQILERLVFYKKAISELNARIQGFAEDAQLSSSNTRELLDMVLTSNSMQSRIFDTMEFSLETVLNQLMTLICNMTLAKRDTLLKSCKGLSTEDTLLLRNSSFTDIDLFPHELINQAENNSLKRASAHKPNATVHPPKRQRRDEDYSSSSYKRSSFRGNSYNSQGRNRGSRGGFRGRQNAGARSSSYRKQ